MTKIGDRVGAVLGATKETCKFLGYGIYEGDFFPEEAIGFMADIRRKAVAEGRMAKDVATNPRLKLDNGEFVYGCECWWGSEEQVKKQIEAGKKAGQEIVEVKMSDVRAEYK